MFGCMSQKSREEGPSALTHSSSHAPECVDVVSNTGILVGLFGSRIIVVRIKNELKVLHS